MSHSKNTTTYFCVIMSSIVEAIAKQAHLTFSRSITDELFADGLHRLIRSVSRIRASDLKISREVIRAATEPKSSAPITYIEVTENKIFSMGMFILKNGARIPLHDHPGMHGVLKVIHGTVKITSYSRLSDVPDDNVIPQDVNNRVKSSQRDTLVPVEKHLITNVSDKDEPCLLRPTEGNFHEVCAVGGSAAFLDILAPPYDMKDRDCHYYVALETNIPDSAYKTWLVRRTPPSDFYCDSAPYTGPKVVVL